MRATLVRLLGALVLVVVALAFSSGRFTPPTLGSSASPSGGSVISVDNAPQHVAAPPVISASGGHAIEQGSSSGSGCGMYDSWCDYCTRHEGSDVCKNYPYLPPSSAAPAAAASTATHAATATATPTATPSSH
jgi:hypothetical protein